jgi:hypothetical protein
MIDCTRIAPSPVEDDFAIIAALSADAGMAGALSQELARLDVPHEVQGFTDAEALVAFLDEVVAQPKSRLDAVIVDLRTFSTVLPRLADRHRQLAILVAAFPTMAVDAATVEAAAHAGAVLIERDFADRESVGAFTAALVEHWFGAAQSLSRRA